MGIARPNPAQVASMTYSFHSVQGQQTSRRHGVARRRGGTTTGISAQNARRAGVIRKRVRRRGAPRRARTPGQPGSCNRRERQGNRHLRGGELLAGCRRGFRRNRAGLHFRAARRAVERPRRCVIRKRGIMGSRSRSGIRRIDVALVRGANRLQNQKEQRKERPCCRPQFRRPAHSQCSHHGLHRSLCEICARQPERA